MPGSEIILTPTDYVTSLIASTANPSTLANQALEDEVMYNLVRDNAAIRIMSHVSNNLYTDPSNNNFTCIAHNFSDSELLTCDLATDPGLHDGSLVISSYHKNSTGQEDDSEEFNFGTDACPQTKLFTVDEPTNSIFDSHLRITSTQNSGNFVVEGYDNSNTSFEAYFTGNGTNQEMFKMLNSQYGNTDNLNLMYVTEDVSFNTTYANGLVTDSYFTLNPSDGTRTVHALDASYTILSNGITIIPSDRNTLQVGDCGTYRIQQFPDTISINVTENSINVPDEYVSNIPIHTTNLLDPSSTYVERLLTDPVTNNQFRSLFDNNAETILPGYDFNVQINSRTDSGFGLDVDQFNNITSRENDFVTLDDSSLAENPYFIRDWVDKSGTLTFQPASVNINTASYGNQLNINEAFELDTGREQLQSSEYSVNGEIILNIGNELTRATVDSETGPAGELIPTIYYEGENARFISNDIKTTPYVNYETQLVMKNPTYDDYFIRDNTSNLNLITNENIVNSYFSADDWTLSSSNAQPNLLEVWKIVPQSRLNAVTELKDSNDVAVKSIFSSAFIENLHMPLDKGSVDSKAVFTLRSVDDLSFYNDFNNAGWTLTSENDGLLEATSDIAFAPENSGYFPDPSQMSYLIDNIESSLNFTVKFNPGKTSSLNPGHITSRFASDFSDRIEITWGESNILQIPQSKITRIYDASSVDVVTVNPSTYSLSSYLSGRNIEINEYTSTKSFRVSFNLGLRPYSTLHATSPIYTVTTVYHIGKDLTTGETIPTGLLTRTNVIPLNDINKDYSKIDEQITSLTELSVTSSIVSDDIKEFNVKIQTQGDDLAWFDLSEQIRLSSFYSTNPTNFNLINTYDLSLNNTDISILLQYQYMNFIDNTSEEAIVNLNDQNGYYIDLNNNYESNFTLYNWSSLITDLSLPDGVYISPSNGYSALNNSWTTNNYSLQIIYGSQNNSQTILKIIKNTTQSVEHTITVSNYKTIGTPIYIARTESGIDTWRIVKSTGYNNLQIENVDTRYMSTNYIDPSNNPNIFEIENGVQLTHSPLLNISSITTPGKTINFTLLSDKISVSLVGNAPVLLNRITWNGESSDITYDMTNIVSDNGLYFRHRGQNDSYSKSLFIRYYRGFKGTQSINQYYTINRDITKMTIKWSDGTGSYEQRDILSYYLGSQTVNDMYHRDSNGNLVNDTSFRELGLILNTNYSMLADNDSRTYPIYTRGDDVVINIRNPNYVSFTDVTINETLKQYSLYDFSGNNYNGTGEKFRLFSTMLKTYNNIEYTIHLTERVMRIYKVDEHIGNPALKGELDLYTQPTNWGDHINIGNYSDTVNGLDIPGYIVKRNTNANYMESISFFVIHPPMLKFSAAKYTSCPSSIPIDLNNPSNGITIYEYSLPVNDTQLDENDNPLYNPFAESITFTNVDGTVTTVTNNPNIIDNVTFIQKQWRYLWTYTILPNGEIKRFDITGSNISIDLYRGLSSDNFTEDDHVATLFNGIASDLLTLGSVTDPNSDILKLVTSLSNNTGAQIAFLQQDVPPFSVNSTVIFGMENTSNITFTVPNFFLGTVTNPITLNLPTGAGTVLNMYARKLIRNSLTGETQIVLYKYEPSAITNTTPVVDWNNFDITSNAVVSVVYNYRKRKIINLRNRTLQQSYIQTLNDLLDLVPKSDIENQPWVLDPSFNTPVRFTFSSFNIDCLQETLPKFMAPPNALPLPAEIGHAKFNVITRTRPFRVVDKFGFPMADFDHDGILRANTISTGSILLCDVDTNTPLTLDQVTRRPVITFSRGRDI